MIQYILILKKCVAILVFFDLKIYFSRMKESNNLIRNNDYYSYGIYIYIPDENSQIFN